MMERGSVKLGEEKMSRLIKSEIEVQGIKINIQAGNQIDFISLY